MKTQRLVQILHKRIKNALAVGTTFTFRSGRSYKVLVTGALERVHPLKPYKGKAEMKQYKKQRQALRAQAA